MNNEIKEASVIEAVIREAENNAFHELNELQLALVGGGIADVIAG